MKIFVIETRKGQFVALPQMIGGHRFPISYLSLEASTHFPFRLAANSA